METPKLSYYQRNKDKILAKRKLQREERAKLGRPFLNDDEEIVLEPEPVVEPVPEPLDPEPIDPVVTFLDNVVIQDEKKTRVRKAKK